MKIKIPLTPKRGAGGVLHYRPLVQLEVRTRDMGFAWLEFLVDTGADVTTIPVVLAQAKQLDFATTHQASSSGVGGTVPHYANDAIRFRVRPNSLQLAVPACRKTIRRSFFRRTFLAAAASNGLEVPAGVGWRP